MADNSLPPLVSFSGNATRGNNYGNRNQVTAVVDVHQPFDGPRHDKTTYQLPDGIVIKPDPAMPSLMSVSYEEPGHYGDLNRPKELGQVKVLPHADVPVFKQEVCDTLDSIKERLNQSDSNGLPNLQYPIGGLIDVPTNSTPISTTNGSDVPPLKTPAGPRSAPSKKKSSPLKLTPSANGNDKKKGQKRKAPSPTSNGSSVHTPKKSSSQKYVSSKSKDISTSPTTSNAFSDSHGSDVGAQFDPFEFDEPNDFVAPVLKSPGSAKKSKTTSSNTTKSISPSKDSAGKRSTEKSSAKKSSPKKGISLRIALNLKEPKVLSGKAEESKKKGNEKGKKSDSFTKLKPIDSKKSADAPSGLDVASTSKSGNVSETVSVESTKKSVKGKSTERDGTKKKKRKGAKDNSKKNAKVVIIGEDALAAHDESESGVTDNVGIITEDVPVLEPKESHSVANIDKIPPEVAMEVPQPIEETVDEDLSIIVVPPPPAEVGSIATKPIVIEPLVDGEADGETSRVEDNTDLNPSTASAIAPGTASVSNGGQITTETAAEIVESTRITLANILEMTKKTHESTKTVIVEDPVPLTKPRRGKPIRQRSKSPVKGKSQEKQDKARRMGSPLRSPMSPAIGNIIEELEAEDMDLALDIASRIEDQFTEAEFEQLFNSTDAAAKSSLSSAKSSAIASAAKKIQTKEKTATITRIKTEPPSGVSTENYNLLDLYIPLKDCGKKKPQSLLKVPPRPNKLRRCEKCKAVFTDNQAFALHKWSHEKEKFACKDCDTYYTSAKNLQWHIKVTHKKTGNFQCRFCPKRFLHEAYKNSHEKLHMGTSKYMCRICGKMFFGMTGYRGHMRRHLGFEPFKCKKCGKGFALIQELNHHVIRHTGNKKFKCKLCGRGFYGLYECKRHEFSHTGERPYKCKYCGKRYSNKFSCEAHEKYHSGELEFQCPVCNKRFATKHQLRAHSLFHSDVKPYKCQYCEKAFINRQILVVHERTHTKEKPYRCNYCDKSFAQMSDRKSHQRIHTGEKPYACKVCPARFRKLGALKGHEKTHTGERTIKCDLCSWVHPDQEQARKHKVKHQKGIPMPCFFCNRTFADLPQHEKEKHLEEKEPYRCTMCNQRFITFQQRYLHEKSYTSATTRKFRCMICHEDFCRRNIRDKHERNHIQEREKAECPICNKIYVDKSVLKSHMNIIHNNNRPKFTCQFCSKQFLQESYMKKHEAIHLGLDEKLNCDMCDYVTNRKSLLRKHKEGHLNGTFKERKNPFAKRKPSIFLIKEDGGDTTPGSPVTTPKTGPPKKRRKISFKIDDDVFPCPEEDCDMEFQSYFSLLAHLRAHSGSKEHKCDLCSQKFGSNKDLKGHIKKTHGKTSCQYCRASIAMHDMEEHEKTHEAEQDPYKCNFCLTGFPTAEERDTHEATHTGPKPFVCTICDHTFPCKSMFSYHRRCHTGDKPFECLTCKKRFRMSSTLTEHVRRMHVAGRLLKCKVCPYVSSSHAEKKQHMKLHQRERRHQCDMCPMAFYKGDHLRAHKQRHLGIKPFKCDVCTQPFSSRHGLNKHLSKFHPDTESGQNQKLINCDVCKASFTSELGFKRHRCAQKTSPQLNFECHICGQKFCRKSAWMTHVSSHKDKVPENIYTCKTCDRKFASMASLNFHQVYHFKEQQLLSAQQSSSGDADAQNDENGNHGNLNDENSEQTDQTTIVKRELSSDFAQDETADKVQAKKTRRVNRKKGAKPKDKIKCVVCGLSFNTAKNLDKHIENAHPEVAPLTDLSEYTCAICDMSFPKKILLIRHMKSHQLGDDAFNFIPAVQGVLGAQLGDANNNSPLAKDLTAASIAAQVTAKAEESGMLPDCIDGSEEGTSGTPMDVEGAGPTPDEDTTTSSVSSTANDKNTAKKGNISMDAALNDSVSDPGNVLTPSTSKGVKTKTPKSRKSVSETPKSAKPKNPQVHDCQICGKTFQRLGNLKTHMEKHKDSLESPAINAASNKEVEADDLSTTDVHGCPLCSKVFKVVRTLKAHLMKMHKTEYSALFETSMQTAESPQIDTGKTGEEEPPIATA